MGLWNQMIYVNQVCNQGPGRTTIPLNLHVQNEHSSSVTPVPNSLLTLNSEYSLFSLTLTSHWLRFQAIPHPRNTLQFLLIAFHHLILSLSMCQERTQIWKKGMLIRLLDEFHRCILMWINLNTNWLMYLYRFVYSLCRKW